MILRDSLTSIGEIHKPHGIHGGLNASLDLDINPGALPCIVLDVDGIFVPFFINEARPKGGDWLIFIDGITNESEAALYANHEIFARKDALAGLLQDDEDADGFYLSDLIGWTVRLHNSHEPLGVIDGFDDSTANALIFVLTPDGRKVIIPMTEDFITDIDQNTKSITMDLPEGLLEL